MLLIVTFSQFSFRSPKVRISRDLLKRARDAGRLSVKAVLAASRFINQLADIARRTDIKDRQAASHVPGNFAWNEQTFKSLAQTHYGQ